MLGGCFVAAWAVLGSPQPPRLPKSFSVTLTEEQKGGAQFEMGQHLAFPGQSASFFFETGDDGTVRQRLNSSSGFAATAWTLYTPANNSLRIFAKFANDCRPLPVNFTFEQGLDLSWLPWATFTGDVRVGLLKKANRFFYADKRAPFNYSAAVDKASGRILYVDSTWTGHLPGTCPPATCRAPTLRMRFGADYEERVLPASLFTIPVEGCFQKVPECADGVVTEMDVYLAHPHQFRSLDNEDSGDARGDVIFICPDLLQPGSSAFNLYDAVSRWRVEVDTHWGQYHTYIHACMHACIHTCMHACIQTCIHT